VFALSCNLFCLWNASYASLPPNWGGICALALLTPQINIIPNNQSLPIPLVAYTWSKRAIQIIPLLVANSWSFWDNRWIWASWVLPLAGPLFMVLLALLFGPCILNTFSKFISWQVQKIKLQFLVKEYSSLLMHDPSVQFYWSPLGTTWVNSWDKCPYTSPPPSTLLSTGSSQMRYCLFFPSAVGCSSQRGGLVGSTGSEDKMSQCPHSLWEHCEPYIL
jgi:hypothetical protein